MSAVYEKEIKSYFTGGIGYVYTAFSLVIAGIFTLVCNLSNYYYASFEYTVVSMAFYMYLLLIPILTMKIVADERKQKTDQLLYSLPLKMSKIVFGKYFAAVTVLAVPTGIMCVIPLLLSFFGDVEFLKAYSAIFALFLLGASLIAIGMFISSLTESMIVSVVVTLVFILINYLITYLSNYVSSSAFASGVTFTVLACVAAFLVYLLTKNRVLSEIVGVVLVAAVVVTGFVKGDLLAGACPALLNKIALFDYLQNFGNGLFDLQAVCIYISTAALFVFLTVQSFEKRRWA